MNTFSRILKYGLKGGVMAVILNVIIFEIALRGFDVEFNTMLGGSPGKVYEWNVILASLVPSVLASILYFILAKKTKQPDKIFRIVAIAILLFSFNGPFRQVSGLSAQMVLSLMHIVAFFEITKALTHDLNKGSVVSKLE